MTGFKWTYLLHASAIQNLENTYNHMFPDF